MRKEPKVETYQLMTTNGDPIRKATRVIFTDGYQVSFTEKLPKKEAIKQARFERCIALFISILEKSLPRDKLNAAPRK